MMISLRQICSVIVLTIALVIVLASFASESEAEGDIVVSSAEYDSVSGKITFAGTAVYPFVSVAVSGDGFDSQLDSCRVENGSFSDTFYIGDLSEGTYRVSARYSGHEGWRELVVDKSIVVTKCEYNNFTGKITFAGTAVYPFVSVAVSGDGFDSQLDSCRVENGSFSDTFYIGDLSEGEYKLIIRYADVSASTSFSVVLSGFTIDSVVFEEEDAHMTIMGVNSTGIDPEIKVASPLGTFCDCTYWLNPDGKFVAYAYLGSLVEEGAYTICFADSLGTTPLSYQYHHFINSTESVDSLGNVTRDDGHTLVRFEGAVNEYHFPSTVTKVLDGAFSNSKINTIVLDRDLIWKIDKLDGMSYMFQECDLKAVILKEGVTTIPDYLFAKTGITYLNIPSSVSTIGVKSFYDCNGLESITFSPNSCITAIGEYSFSFNESLRQVMFGSSKTGYKCDIGVAAFMFCQDLEMVHVDDSFYIKSIGSLAFTKAYDYYQYPNPCAIKFNSDCGILIPKEVEDIGYLSFSVMSLDAVIPNLPSNSEPTIGYYKYYGDGYIYSTNQPVLVGDNFEIIFEDNSQVTSVGKCAFAGYRDVILINLSSCDGLLVIEQYAFIVNNGVLLLPPNIEEIKESFMGSRFDSDYEIPNSLRVFISSPAFRGNITALEGSLLETYSENYYDSGTLDLSNCNHLKSVRTSHAEIILPTGVFDYEGPYNIENMATTQDGNLIIDANTRMVFWDQLEVDGVICSESNPYFKIDNGCLYHDGVNRTLLFVLDSPYVSIADNVVIPNGVLRQNITELIIGSNVYCQPGAFRQADNLQLLKISGDCDLNALEMSLRSLTSHPSLYLGMGVSDSVISRLSTYGHVFVALSVNGGVIYAPAVIDGMIVHYAVSAEENSIFVDLDLDKYVILSSGVDVSISGNALSLSNMQQEAYLHYVAISDSARSVSVTLDGNGGLFGGSERVSVTVQVETTLAQAMFIVPELQLNRFVGWSLDGCTVLASDYVISVPCTLFAVWENRGPQIFIDSDIAMVYNGSEVIRTSEVMSGSNLELNASPIIGFELLEWVVNGQPVSSANNALSLTNITTDQHISLTYRYCSPSSGLNSITERGLPTSEEILDLVKVSELGGVLGVSTAVWTGHASVPLIVNNTIYFRAGNYLYAAESDTGFITASVLSAEAEDYYHQLGYGDGVIIDYKTGKVYDLSLNQLFVLDNSVFGAEYYNGLFYTSGSNVYSFTSTDDDPSRPDEIKTMNFVGYINGTYSSYGFSRSVFVDHYMYRVVTDGGFERGITAMDLDTGAIATMYLRSIRSMFLDDGWISYHDGYIYLPGYTTGLFGATATIGYDTLAYVHVDGLVFGDELSYVFVGETGFPSELVVYENIAYMACGGTFYSFSINDGLIDVTSIRSTDIVGGHGSIVIDTCHANDVVPAIYAYVIPYTSFNVGMTVIEDKGGVLTSTFTTGLPGNYNSQALRADLDGRAIWYNDSGHIFDYTTPDNNAFYFFIEDGGQAKWYVGYGRSAPAALASLGKDVVTLDVYQRITSVYGGNADNVQIWVLKQIEPTAVSDNLMNYSWERLYDLYDRGYDVCHYYRIKIGTDVITQYSYLDKDGTVSQYVFENNIGNREMIGVPMIPGADYCVVKFYYGDEEIIEMRAIISLNDLKKYNLPTMIGNGVRVTWKDSEGNAISTIQGTTLNGTELSLIGESGDVANSLYIDAFLSSGSDMMNLTISLEGATQPMLYLRVITDTIDGLRVGCYAVDSSKDWKVDNILLSNRVNTILIYAISEPTEGYSNNVCFKVLQGASGQ